MTAPATASSPDISSRSSNYESDLFTAYSAGDIPSRWVFRLWYWALVPALAFVAYATALRIGFLSDDLVILSQASSHGIDLKQFLPDPNWIFYRPIGTLLTWQVGWALWGDNPLPYHLLGLFIHAGTALALGLWLAEVTGRRTVGWLAGALFAVFPLNTEAVGWLAAQWDAWAALFGVAGLGFFTAWWRTTKDEGRRTKDERQDLPSSSVLRPSSIPHSALYWLSVLLYGLGVFSKESMLAFLPMYALSAWLVLYRTARTISIATGIPHSALRTPHFQRLGLALLPFCVLLALNIGLRFAAWGNIGGVNYQNRPSYASLFWDGLWQHARTLLSPINPTVLGDVTAQVVGTLCTLFVLAGLVLFGKQHIRLLTGVGAWILLALLPVLNLGVASEDLEQNRILYLASAGYCALLALFLYEVARRMARWRIQAAMCISLILLLGVAVCWLHLRPWHTATVQARAIDHQLDRLIPPHSHPNGMVWYAEDAPATYEGAYIYPTWLGEARKLSLGGDVPIYEQLPNASISKAEDAPLATERRDAFALRFSFDPASTLFYVSYAEGVTGSNAPPQPGGEAAGADLMTWDFQQCAPSAIGAWQVHGAKTTCEPGNGLAITPDTDDAGLESPTLNVDTGLNSAGNSAGNASAVNKGRFVRLRVSASYPAGKAVAPYSGQWLWRGPTSTFKGKQSRFIALAQDGKPHVYWTFIPISNVGPELTNIRFNPVSGPVPAEVQWVALDLVL